MIDENSRSSKQRKISMSIERKKKAIDNVFSQYFANLDAEKHEEEQKYLKWHGIEQTSGYSFHHIIPMEYIEIFYEKGKRIRTERDQEILDDYRGLVYIKNGKHSKIPHWDNWFIELVIEGNKVFLNDISTKKKIEITNDIMIKSSNLPKMIEYNKKILAGMMFQY